MSENKVPENKAYKVTLILLVGLAAFSTAMKDLGQLQEMAGSLQRFASQWRGTDLVMLDADSISINDACPNSGQQVNSATQFGSSDGVPSVGNIEVETIENEGCTEPEIGGKVEAVARKKANRNMPLLARAKYAPARNFQEETSAKRGDGRWQAHFEFRTFDRAVTMDLPLTLVNEIKTVSLENEASPDFPLSLLGKISRKQSRGKTDSRREFTIKRIDRNISSRPVS